MAAPTTRRRFTLWNSLGFPVVGAIMLLATVLYSTVQFGVVEGTEFSPQSFQRRQFSYLEIPLVRIQVTPISHTDITSAFEKHLAQQILKRNAAASARWDLIRATNGNTVAAVGDAQILCNYLDATNNGGNAEWFDWTKKHPQASQVIWPAVARLAELELYVLVPELLTLTRAEYEIEELREQVGDLLAERCLALAVSQQKLGRHRLAIELFDEVLEHQPDHEQARVGRDQSQRALKEAAG